MIRTPIITFKVLALILLYLNYYNFAFQIILLPKAEAGKTRQDLSKIIYFVCVTCNFDFRGVLSPLLHEQFLCDNFYLTAFICRSTEPRLHEQFLCDKFYLFASERSFYTSTFYLKTKDWRLETMAEIKKIANFMCCVVSSTRTIFCMWQFLFAT